MKLLLSLVLLLIINIGLQAQSIKYSEKQTEEFRQKGLVKRSFSYNLLGEDDEAVYYDFLPYFQLFGYSQGYTNAHFICKVDKDLKTTKKLIVDFGKKENLNVQKLLYLNNKIYAIKTDEEGLTICKIGKTTGIPSKKKIVLIPNTTIGPTYFRKNYSFKISEDKKLLMVFYYLVNEKLVPQKFAVYVFDMDFDLLWKNKNIKPDFEGGYFSFSNFKISNKGEVYFLGSISLGDKESFYEDGISHWITFDIDKAGKHFQLYHIYDDGDEMEHIDLTFSNNYMIRDVNYTVNSKDITLYGVYCDEDMVSAQGVFTAKANFKTEVMESIQTKSFTRELITKGYDKKRLKFFNDRYPNEEWDAFHYDLGEIKTNNDGNLYFVAEQWIRGRAVHSYMTCFLFKDLYIVPLNEGFEIGQLNKIVKTQFSPISVDRCSYGSLEGDRGTYFIFNNFLGGPTPMTKKGNTQIVRLSPSGKQEINIIRSDFNNSTPVFLSTTFIKTAPLEFIFERASFMPRKYAFVKMKIEE